jgi:hypothetical protein
MLGIEEELSNRTSWARRFNYLFDERNSSRKDCPETVNLRGEHGIERRSELWRLREMEDKTADAFFDPDEGSEIPFIEMFQRDVLGNMSKQEQIDFRANNM